jgi:hypothetical protein
MPDGKTKGKIPEIEEEQPLPCARREKEWIERLNKA